MKKVLAFIIMLLPIVAMAQFYNPYLGHNIENCPGKVTCGACHGTGNCYGYVCMSCSGTGLMNCTACAAYRQGEQIAKQIRQQRWNSAYYTFEDGMQALMNKSYNYALKCLKRSAELGNGSAMAYVGNMYELGLGVEVNTQTARTWYNKGYNINDNLSTINLNRVKEYGFWESNASNRSTYIQNLKSISDIAKLMSFQIINGMDFGSSSGSSSSSGRRSRSSSGTGQSEYGYVNCTHCHGSGRCSVCNGQGWVYSTYTQNPSSCSSCQGRKKCVFCQGNGKRYRRMR